jgi:hypothetical protein
MNYLKNANVLSALVFTTKFATNVETITSSRTITAFSVPLIQSLTKLRTDVTVKMGSCSESMVFVWPNAQIHKLMIRPQDFVNAFLDWEDSYKTESVRSVLPILNLVKIPKFVVLAKLTKFFLKESVFAKWNSLLILPKFVFHVRISKKAFFSVECAHSVQVIKFTTKTLKNANVQQENSGQESIVSTHAKPIN